MRAYTVGCCGRNGAPKAQEKKPEALTSAVVGKAAFKSGMYVNVERDTSIDVGWRVGPQVTVGKGPLEVELVKEEVDISIVSTVSAMLGLEES